MEVPTPPRQHRSAGWATRAVTNLPRELGSSPINAHGLMQPPPSHNMCLVTCCVTDTISAPTLESYIPSTNGLWRGWGESWSSLAGLPFVPTMCLYIRRPQLLSKAIVCFISICVKDHTFFSFCVCTYVTQLPQNIPDGLVPTALCSLSSFSRYFPTTPFVSSYTIDFFKIPYKNEHFGFLRGKQSFSYQSMKIILFSVKRKERRWEQNSLPQSDIKMTI